MNNDVITNDSVVFKMNLRDRQQQDRYQVTDDTKNEGSPSARRSGVANHFYVQSTKQNSMRNVVEFLKHLDPTQFGNLLGDLSEAFTDPNRLTGDRELSPELKIRMSQLRASNQSFT